MDDPSTGLRWSALNGDWNLRFDRSLSGCVWTAGNDLVTMFWTFNDIWCQFSATFRESVPQAVNAYNFDHPYLFRDPFLMTWDTLLLPPGYEGPSAFSVRPGFICQRPSVGDALTTSDGEVLTTESGDPINVH